MEFLNTVKYAHKVIISVFALIIINASCSSEKPDGEGQSEKADLEEKNPKVLGSDAPSNNPKTLGGEQQEITSKVIEGSEITKKEATEILPIYFVLKDALVEGKHEKATKSAGEILEIILLKKDDFSRDIITSAENIMQSTQIEQQREHFAVLSQSIYTLARQANLGKELYYQYCPMAFNNTGAYWLSAEKEISNPYFGDEMLRCGSTKETIE